MAENNSKDLISNEVLQKATQDILQTVSEHLYDYEPYTNEEIAEIFDLDEVTSKSLSKVINDEYVAKNKVFSNEHTMELLSKTLAEANQYTTEQIANSGKLERKIVTSTSEVINENILYLILTDSTNNIYTQYMLIDGNATPLGTTEINLNDYLKTIDFNTKIDEYAKKNTVVLQNDVVGDLTTLSSNQVLSTQGVSDELDKKVDKTSIVTSIDSSSTDEQVPSAKSVYDNYNIKLNNDYYGVPNVEKGIIFDKNADGSRFTFRPILNSNILQITVDDIKDLFCLFSSGKGTIMGKDICTSEVSDVSLTRINTYESPVASGGEIAYIVKNGICYVNIQSIMISKAREVVILSNNMPKCKFIQRCHLIDGGYNYVGGAVIDTNSTQLAVVATGEPVYIHGSFSYPVAG